MARDRILLVKTSSLGDVVHALPALTDLARARPGSTIDWLVEEAFADVPRLHPSLARVVPLALRRWRRAPFARATRDAVGALRRDLRLAGYGRAVDCQGLVKSALVASWAAAPVTGYDRRSAREPLAALWYERRIAVSRTLHAIERNRRLVAAAFDYPLAGPPDFGIVAPADADAAPHAVLLTNASRPTKLWPSASWEAVERRLAARGLESRLFWGSEAERVATAARAAPMRAARVMPPASIGAIAASLAGARLVIGLDTGLTHLAAALGRPTIGIFCDYDPALVGLVGSGRCLSLGSAAGGPTAERVVEALDALL